MIMNSTRIPTQPFPGIPIVFGVTGHRNLREDDSPVLSQKVELIFKNFRHRYPRSPFKLLSMLAPGADQLVAEVAFGLDRIEVVAPLPFPSQLYQKSTCFEGFPGQLKKYQKWIEEGRISQFVVPFPDGPASGDVEGWESYLSINNLRHAAYANAGGYIVNHCHVLIAISDDQSSGKNSGTSEIMDYKLWGIPPNLYPCSRPLGRGNETGPVYRIFAPKSDRVQAQLIPKTGDVKILFGLNEVYEVSPDKIQAPPSHQQMTFNRLLHAVGMRKSSSWLNHMKILLNYKVQEGVRLSNAHLAELLWANLEESCRAVEHFNSEADDILGTEQWTSRLKSKKTVFLWKLTEKGVLLKDLQKIIYIREMAAHLATGLEKQVKRRQIGLYALVGFSAAFNLGYQSFENPNVRWIGWLIFFILFLSTIFLVTQVWHDKLTERRLDYRELAETLRVRIYWAVAGLNHSVADRYLNQIKGELSWIRMALKTGVPPKSYWQESFLSQESKIQMKRIALTRYQWVKQQTDYYRNKRKEHEDKVIQLNFLAALWTLLGFLCLSCFNPKELWTGPSDTITIFWLGTFQTITSGLFIIAGALTVNYSERRSHSELAKQYERMLAVFAQGRHELRRKWRKTHNLSDQQETILALGEEAINEHSQWLILRRNRPIDLMIH